MKKLALLAALAVSVVFAGCAAGTLTPAQVASIACPPINSTITQFKQLDATLPGLPAAVAAEAILTKAQAPVAAACTAGATITSNSISALGSQVLPAIGVVAGTLPLTPQAQAEVQAGLIGTEIILGVVGVIAQNIAAAQAAAAVSGVLPGGPLTLPAPVAPAAASALLVAGR